MQHGSRPTIVDVARIAGVSPTTVSYVLSGPEERAARISEETTIRVLSVAREVGYVPNQAARNLRLQRTNRVLFLGSRLNSLYSQAIAHSIERAVTRHGLTLGVQIGSSPDHIERAITALGQNQADGLIVETVDVHVPLLSESAANGHAIVAIGPTEPDSHFDVVSNDIEPAVRQAMEHLAERRYRHFVLMTSFRNPADDHRIHVAFRQLGSLGVPEDDITVLYCPHDRVAAFDCALEFLRDTPLPVAVYAGADISAMGVMWATLRLNLDVPSDVGIVGHGNTPETRITRPPLTSLGPISTDFRAVADLMISRLRDRSLPGRHVSEPCQLTIRGSTQ